MSDCEEEFEDTKGVISSRKSKDKQHNDQQKKNQRTNNDLQNITQKTKYQATRTLLKTVVNSDALKGSAVPAPHVKPVKLLLNDMYRVLRTIGRWGR
jgi:hypothetical protein